MPVFTPTRLLPHRTHWCRGDGAPRAATYRKLAPAQARKPARLTGKMPVLQSRRGGIGRRAGLKIQKSPLLSGYLSLKAGHDFHR